MTYGNNASWDTIRLVQAGFDGGFQLGLDPVAASWVFASGAIFLALCTASLTADRLRPGVLALVFTVLSGLGWHVAARGGAFAEAYAVRLADQVRSARAYSQTLTGVSPDEIVTASSFTEPSLAFSLGTDTVLGTAEEVLAFAESRDEPTMVVLDLSRDAALRTYLTRPASLASTDLQPMAERFAQLRICHQTLASGLNYARGTETVLAIVFTRCASEDTPNDPQD